MKIVEPKYEILTDISEGGIKELQQIERVARVCYKSEDKITPDGESAKKLVGFLVKQGHEAMLEHSQLSVLFTCDRAIANELARHRIASFAQESTRYCNYSKEKFGGELMGEAVEMVVDDLNSHRFMSMRDIEASLADKFNCSPGVADRRMRYALDMAEYRSGGVNAELENLKSTYDIKVLSLKKFLYAAGRSLMTEVSVG